MEKKLLKIAAGFQQFLHVTALLWLFKKIQLHYQQPPPSSNVPQMFPIHTYHAEK